MALPLRAWDLSVCADPDAAPYTSRDADGFDLAIAETLAEALGAELSITWLNDSRSRTLLRQLHGGDCDVTMGVIDGRSGMLSTQTYYRTGYVFVRRAGDSEIASLDDPALRTMTIGVPGDARRPTPPVVGLMRRGLGDKLVLFDYRDADTTMAAELAAGRIDVAILWGPSAAALDAVASGEWQLTALKPEIDLPFMPMVAAFTVGVRPDDVALRDALDGALVDRWDAIQSRLEAAGVPLLPLSRPLPAAADARVSGKQPQLQPRRSVIEPSG